MVFAQHEPPPVGDPLAEIARRATESSDAAADLVRATQADVYRLCRALSDQDSAEDVVQESYLRVFQSLPSFRGDASVRVWILSIARRTAVDHVRRAVRRRRLDTVLRREHRAGSTALHSSVEASDLVAQLPAQQRAAFVLTQLLGLEYAEAATVLGCPVGTIRSRVARARTALADAYDAE